MGLFTFFKCPQENELKHFCVFSFWLTPKPASRHQFITGRKRRNHNLFQNEKRLSAGTKTSNTQTTALAGLASCWLSFFFFFFKSFYMSTDLCQLPFVSFIWATCCLKVQKKDKKHNKKLQKQWDPSCLMPASFFPRAAGEQSKRSGRPQVAGYSIVVNNAADSPAKRPVRHWSVQLQKIEN